MLRSIAVLPANSTIQPLATEQFMAIGVYSNGGHYDITKSCHWSSSDTSIAWMDDKGLAFARSIPGTVTITCTHR